MAISFVGSAGGPVGSADLTVNWTDLLDESGNTPSVQSTDFCVVTLCRRATSNTPPTLVSTGYAAAYANVYANRTDDANLISYGKVVGSDSGVTIASTGFSNTQSYVVHIFRGVDATTPFGSATPTTSTGTNVASPDAPAITPVTAGAWICAAGGGAGPSGGTGLAALTNPANMSATAHHFAAGFNDRAIVALALKTDWTSGAFDPAAFGGGSTATGGSVAAATFVLKPAAGGAASGTGTSTGAATVSGAGASLRSAMGSAGGSSSVAGTAAANDTGNGTATGASAALAIGLAYAAATGSAAGFASLSGKTIATGSAAGTAAATGSGAAQALAQGSSAGTSTADGDGVATEAGEAVGSSSGSATATGEGRSGLSGTGASTGTAEVSGSGAAYSTGAALSEGFGVAVGDGQSIAAAEGSGAGVAAVEGIGSGIVPAGVPASRTYAVPANETEEIIGGGRRSYAVAGIRRAIEARGKRW